MGIFVAAQARDVLMTTDGAGRGNTEAGVLNRQGGDVRVEPYTFGRAGEGGGG